MQVLCEARLSLFAPVSPAALCASVREAASLQEGLTGGCRALQWRQPAPCLGLPWRSHSMQRAYLLHCRMLRANDNLTLSCNTGCACHTQYAAGTHWWLRGPAAAPDCALPWPATSEKP